MKIKIRYLLFILVALLLLVVFVDYLLGVPRIYSINKDFDLNSGDERVYVYVCFLKIKDKIQTTPFSQEIRRLGINIPQERKWVLTSTKLLRLITKRFICPIYGGTPAECNFLIWLFDYGNVPDENRRIILQQIVTILQSVDRKAPFIITEKISDEAEKIFKAKK